MRVRFAPSPTGQLHVGNARTALFNWFLARGSGGTLILRIEDTDARRSTAESEAGILRDLRWLGIDWDEGPERGGPHAPYSQSARRHLYDSHVRPLLASGQAYQCFCSVATLDADRRAAIKAGRSARYAGTCRRLSPEEVRARVANGERPAIRFRIPEGRDVVFTDAVRGELVFQNDVLGDPVIIRADGVPAYNFAVVVDDALMGVTHVVRGEDHISNTPRQILLYEALGFPPPTFAHLALVMGPDHSPLSKRHGSTSVAEFRSKGYLPEALLNYLALIGWSPRDAAAADGSDGTELLPADELARRFSLDDVGRSAGVFDEDKLAWANRHYLRAAEPQRIAELSVDFFRRGGIEMSPDRRALEFLAEAMPIATGSVDRLDQIPARFAFLFRYDPELALAHAQTTEEMRRQGPRDVVHALADALADAPRLDRAKFRAVADALKARTGQKGRALYHPIRVALTGYEEGPELDLAVPAIDRGADLPAGAGLPAIAGCRERAAAFLAALERQR
jgi:nondiscriminating glutamyl-tRNA synthetase